MRARLLVAFLAVSAIVAACSGGGTDDDASTTPTGSGIPSPTDSSASPTPSGASPTPSGSPTATVSHTPTPTPSPPQPTWTWIHQNVIVSRCSGGACHGANAPTGDSLQAITDVVNAPTHKGICGTTHTRVVPNSSATSYFYLKLQAVPPCGVRMPKGGAMLPQTTLDAIKTWIDDGALNN